MSTVYFANSGKINLDVIRVMGVSVKETKSPIGYFGTGLKFALATLLRNGHEVTLCRGFEIYSFWTEEQDIRGEKFHRIFMSNHDGAGEPLPFTTQLGRNWEVWQAYRELHSNTLDEAGEISDRELTGDTVIVVTGDEFYSCYLDRHKIFVDTTKTPLVKNAQIEVYDRPSPYIFYRGVRAGALPGGEGSRFTYNILSAMTLTEDRTIKSMWDLEWKLETILPTLPSEALAYGLLSGTNTWDQNLDFHAGDASPEFVKVASRLRTDASANKTVHKIWDHYQSNNAQWKEVSLGDQHSKEFLTAIKKLQSLLGCDLSPEEVKIADTLGPDVMGLHHAKTDQIWLAKHTFDHGPRYLMAVLYEEWLHKRHRYSDNSRSLQSYLLHRLISSIDTSVDVPQPGDDLVASLLRAAE